MLDLRNLAEAVRYERGVSRRLFLAFGAALAALPGSAKQAFAADRRVSFSSDPFTLGVASGDPNSEGVVLWTRLAPKPQEPDGGMPSESVSVTWEVADDEGMKSVVSRGTAVAAPEFGHSVHVEVGGLKPNHWYFYRFLAGDAISPVGRTRTMPAAFANPDQLRIAFASCQHYEQGLFTAYSQMANDNLDLVFHLGDYIYEYGSRDGFVRKHNSKEIESLTDYRARHSLYRQDPLLRGMHAACPWFVTWDDHEFDNDYASGVSEQPGVDPAQFLIRRANAYQAYYEAMPLRSSSIPRGPDMLIYRKARFGQLAQFMVLDTRQYRSDQPNGGKTGEINAASLDSKATILGANQRAWLQSGLSCSKATWNVLAQQVMMGMVGIGMGLSDSLQPVRKYIMDQWPGYGFERIELMKFIAERKIANPVVLTGDIHSNWVNELRVDDRHQELPVVATEFVTTSISSGGNGEAKPRYHDLLRIANPFVKFHNAERGYVRCQITSREWRSDYITVEDVTKPGGKVSTRASFVIESGIPGVRPV